MYTFLLLNYRCLCQSSNSLVLMFLFTRSSDELYSSPVWQSCLSDKGWQYASENILS